jgi:hypothetical protein
MTVQYLYPSEFLQFVSSEGIPLRWRRAVTLAIYTYTRDAELRVRIHCTKGRPSAVEGDDASSRA